MTMTDAAINPLLEDLLVDLSRSLLQYTHEAWPWAADEASRKARETLDQLAARQQAAVARLAEFLIDREHMLPLDVYPDDYTNLNYVSVKYLLKQIVVNEKAILSVCDDTLTAAEGTDPEAAALVASICESEREILSEVRRLV
jgi:hypothetical protein